MIYATITQQGTELILEKTNLVYRYSSNLEFKFIKDEKFKDYELKGYIQRDEKDYLLEIKEDDTFEVLPEFMDRNKFVRLSFALKNESKVIHLGVVKLYVNDAFGNETTVPPEKQELLVEVVQKEVEKNLEEPLKKVEKVEKNIEQFDSDYQEFNKKLESANKIYDDVVGLKKEIDEDKNDIDKKISSFNEKENQLNTAIDNFNDDFIEKKNQIENDEAEIDKKVSDFNQNVATSKKSIDDQTTSAVELINKTKEQSLNELSETKETIDNDISSKQKDIDGLVENSKKEINDLADNSLENIENKKKSSVEAIDTSKTNALNDVNQSKNKAIKEVEDAGAHYQEQIDDLQKESAAQSVTLENLKGEVELKLNSPYLNNKNAIYITNSDNGLMESLVIEGNTEQVTTNGYQLWDEQWLVGKYFISNGLYYDGSSQICSKNYIEVQPNSTYYAIVNNPNVKIYVCWYDSNKDFITYTNVEKDYLATRTEGVTSPNDARYLMFYVSADYGTSYNNDILITNKPNNASYEPYTGCQPSPSPDFPQKVKGVSEISGKIVGKNLFDINKIKEISNAIKRNDDGSLTITSTSGDSSVNTRMALKDLADLEIGKTYIISFITTGLKQIYLTEVGQWWGSNNALTITQEMLDSNIRLYPKSISSTAIISEIQIEEGSTATDCQPYQSQSFNYTLSNPLYRLSDSVYDYIDVDRGKIVYKTGKLNLNTIQTWYKYQAGLPADVFFTEILDIAYGSILKMNKLINIESCWNKNIPNVASIHPSYHNIYVNVSNISDVESFKSWLQNNDITVYYELTTPVEEPLPSDLQTLLQSLKSYYPQTNIMFDTEVEPYINFDYKLNLKSWIEDKDNKEIIYDKQNKEKDKYSSTFFENMFALQRTSEIYTVKFPKWETSHISTGEKLDANAGLVCEPSTKTIKGQNDYANISLFKTYDVNAYVDDEGVRHVTAIKGDKDFKDEGKVDVFVLGMSYYEKVWEDDQYWYYSRTDSPRDGYTVARECINRDGSIQPFALYAKYVSGFIDKVPYSSKGLIPGRVYSSTPLPSEDSFSANNSYNNMITNYHKKGNFYCGGMTCDYKYILSTFYLKYATLNTQSIMYGCANCNFQYKAAIQSEDKNTYFPVTKSQATQIEIGSSVSVGYQSKFSSTITVDRAYSNTHRYADDVKVLKKEDLDDSNVAIYLDIDEPFNTMPVTIADGVESEIYISSMHWQSGFSDDVLDRDGCPCETKAQLVNGKFPMVIQGIEIMVGGYETYANAFMDTVDATGKREVYIQNDASLLTTNMTTAKTTYKKSPYAIQPTKLNSWNYITRIDFDLENGVFVQTGCGQESSGTGVGFADGIYVDSASSGQREFLALGNLWNGGAAGLSCLNANGSLGGADWDILSRLSINGVGGELTTG